MNKKQLIVSLVKKILAFTLDIIIVFLLILILEFIMLILSSPFIAKEYLKIIERLLDILLLFVYFYFIPKLIGNTFGRKMLKIKEKFNIFWSPLNKLDKFPEEHLKKNGVLKVVVKEGKWVCPSCHNLSLENYDVCDICGQEIEKING